MRNHLLDQIERLKAAELANEQAVTHDVLIRDRWREDVFAWARERLGLPLKRWSSYAPDLYKMRRWDGTNEPLGAISNALADWKSCAVFSATGVGKTFFAAVVTLWFLDCWEGSQVITIAPKEDQLKLHVWKEIRRLWPLFRKLHPRAELQASLNIRMRPDRHGQEVELDAAGIPKAFSGWGAVGFPCGVSADEEISSRARGFHAEHMLFIIEETTGVHDSILKAIKVTCVAPHNLRLFLGNPDSVFDGLSRAAADVDVVSVRASALDHPNVVANDPSIIPGASTKKMLENWEKDFGGRESPLWQSRARGVPPPQASDALFRKDWLDAAVARNEDDREGKKLEDAGPPALGLDVGDTPGGDEAVIVRGIGARVVEVRARPVEQDSAQWARQHVWPLIESGMIEPNRVGIDPVGVGASPVNEMRRLMREANFKGEIVKLGGADKPRNQRGRSEKFKNLRSQMYWQARVDLYAGTVGMPRDAKLMEELLVMTWWTHNGLIFVMPKEEIKEQIGRSPDRADAWVYWNWIRQYTKLRFEADASGWAP